MSFYRVRTGNRDGQIGEMIGRVADVSNNDIKLRFDSGDTAWYQYNEVQPLPTSDVVNVNILVDWEVFEKQKDLLVEIRQQHPLLQGILDIIDLIQESGIESGIPKKRVHPVVSDTEK